MKPNETMLLDYHKALESGNRLEVLRLANLIDWTPAMVAKTPSNPVNYAMAIPKGVDHEGVILTRQESMERNWI